MTTRMAILVLILAAGCGLLLSRGACLVADLLRPTHMVLAAERML